MTTFAFVGFTVLLGASILFLRDSAGLVRSLGHASLAAVGFIGLSYVWKGLLWPVYFSPLRHLRTVPDSGFLSKETLRLYTEARGVPQSEWVNKLYRVPPEGVVRYRSILGFERLLIVSPEALAEVLVTKSYEFRKPAVITTQLEQILGKGVLLAEGHDHRVQRKMLLPAFAFRHVKELYQVIWPVAVQLIDTMTEKIQGTAPASPGCPALPDDKPGIRPYHEMVTVDIADLASRATLDIIGTAGMGREFGAIRNPENALHRTYSLLFQTSKEAMFLGVLRLVLPGWLVNRLPLKRNTQVYHAVQTVRSLCRQMICEARSRQVAHKAYSDVDSGEKNILTVAIASGAFTDESLVDQVMTFLAAGHETTATALTWAIYIMCVRPEIQTKLRNEVRSSLPSPRTSAPGDLQTLIDNHMPYLHAVCQEVFRYFSPVPVTFREAVRNTSILQTPVPAGTMIVLAPRVTNRDNTLWGCDSQLFNPNRWLSSNKRDESIAASSAMSSFPDDTGRRDERSTTPCRQQSRRSNFATMTFLHGPRSCIGQSFAQAELAILLATLIGRFEFDLAKGTPRDDKFIKISRGATARPEAGLLVQARIIEGW